MSLPIAEPRTRELPWKVRGGIALAAASATIAFVYAIVRLTQIALFPPEPDPATVIWTAKAALFWRFWIGAYVAGMVGIGAYAWSGTQPEAAARWLPRFVVVAALAIALQGALLP